MWYVPTDSRHRSWEKLRQVGRNDEISSQKSLVPAASPCSKCKQTKQNSSCRQRSLQVKGVSWNSNFSTRPDLLNRFMGTLSRFREKPIAVPADIGGMFIQVGIRNKDQSALHFLQAIDIDVRLFQFTELFFGAVCSPSCAIFPSNRCSEDDAET